MRTGADRCGQFQFEGVSFGLGKVPRNQTCLQLSAPVRTCTRLSAPVRQISANSRCLSKLAEIWRTGADRCGQVRTNLVPGCLS